MRKIILAMSLIFLFSSCIATKEMRPLASLSNGRTGTIYFESWNPYTPKDILNGTGKDRKATVFGVLNIPKTDKTKVPAIVFVHAYKGWAPVDDQYLEMLNNIGIATFQLDCLTPRSALTAGFKVSSSTMVADAYNALKLLATHPQIDKNRIGIMGRSFGGTVSLLSSWEPIQKAMTAGGIRFACHIALYPVCFGYEDMEMSGAPILILAGEKDDWVSTKACLEYASSMKSAGYKVHIVVYPNAHHGFDLDFDPRYIADPTSVEKCRFVVEKSGSIIEKITGLPVDKPETLKKILKKCGTRGVHLGGNAFAREESMKEIRNFAKRVFGL